MNAETALMPVRLIFLGVPAYRIALGAAVLAASCAFVTRVALDVLDRAELPDC